MKTMAVRLLLLGLFTFHFLPLSFAHDDSGDQDPYELAVRYGTLFERIAQLDFGEGSLSEAPAVATVRIKGRNYYLNDSFYTVMEEVFRLYAEDIESLCPNCEVPSPEDLSHEARELVAKGWLTNLGEASAKNILSRYGGEFVDLGARYGHMAGILKVMGELAEDALLVIFKMPGAHFLCDVITMVVSANAAKVSTLFNVWKNAKGLERGSIREISRLVATSYAAKRSLGRIKLEFGPVEVDPQLFSDEDTNDPRKAWLAHEIGDERRFQRFFSRADTLISKYSDQIGELEKQKLTASDRKKRRLDRQITRLRNKMSNQFKVKRKVFEGRRLGYTFLIFKRKRRMSLYSDEPAMSSLVKGSKAWMVPMTATLTTPGFIFKKNHEEEAKHFVERVTHEQAVFEGSDIEQILLSEAKEKGLEEAMLQRIFADVESLFDTNSARRVRYVKTLGLHAFVGDFMSRLAKKYIGVVRGEILQTGPVASQTRKLWGLQWRVGRLTYFSSRYTDYLKSISLVKGKSPLTNESAFAKEYFVRLISAYEVLGRLKDIPTISEVEDIKRELDVKIAELKANQFWVEKRAVHSILPVRQMLASILGLGRYNLYRRRPQCGQLYF